MVWAWVSIGSNLDREQSVRCGLSHLRSRFGQLKLSSVYESAAIGFEGQPFFNLVAGFHTREPVADLVADLRSIEDACGRVRGPEKFAPRTLDIDLLTYGDLTGVVDGYELPRDEILRYGFVLGPLAEIAPDELHPTEGRSFGDLWRRFDRNGAMMRRVHPDIEV